MDSRCFVGGILGVLEIADAHPSEIRADFRALYGCSWDDVGITISWIEAIHLVRMLLRNPSSWLQAQKNGWKHPVDFNWMIQAQQLDAFIGVNSKGGKGKPIPKPWPSQDSSRVGKATRTQSEIRARLERMNMKES